jgi:hypothetical protein
VYDYVDAEVPVLARMASKRQTGYRMLGYRLRPQGQAPTALVEVAKKEERNERRPSEVFDEYWITADRREGSYPEHTARGGKWMIFVRNASVDEWWSKIKPATESGRLGGGAKVATMKPNPVAADPDSHGICAYTYDANDSDDYTRVREALRDLGVTWKIPYKADTDTRAGRYAKRGGKRISRRYE